MIATCFSHHNFKKNLGEYKDICMYWLGQIPFQKGWVHIFRKLNVVAFSMKAGAANFQFPFEF